MKKTLLFAFAVMACLSFNSCDVFEDNIVNTTETTVGYSDGTLIYSISSYNPNQNGSAGVKGCNPASVEVVIPSCIRANGNLFDVTSIRNDAFVGCTLLEKVTIPSKVAEIRYNAFYECTSLKNVYILASLPPTLTSNSFGAIEGATLHVVKGSKKYYENSSWKKFFNEIVEDAK